MGRAEYGGRHRRPSCRHRRGPAAVGQHRRTHTVPDRQTAVSESRPDSGASTARPPPQVHEYERRRPTENIRSLLVLVLRWYRIGTTDVSPTTAPKNFVSEFVKARSGAFALDGAPSNPSLSTIPADRAFGLGNAARQPVLLSNAPHSQDPIRSACSFFVDVQLF